MKYYFLHSVNESGVARLRPLPNQTFEDGSRIFDHYNCEHNKGIKAHYPLGTVFCSAGLYDSGLPMRYSMKNPADMKVVESEIPIRSSDMPNGAMAEAWGLYKRTTGFDHSSVRGESGDIFETKEETVGNLLGDIRKDYPRPTIEEDGFFVDQACWDLLVRNILKKESTLLVGPMGTGKTELVLKAADKLSIPCHVYDMGSMHDPMTQMLGTHRLVKDPETGTTVSSFDYAKFTEDVQHEGIILLDELSRAPLTTLNILFPCLDSRRMLPVEMAGGTGLRNINVHPGVIFIATANLGAEYTGTNTLDKALVSRFFPVELKYLDKNTETDLLQKRTGCPRNEAFNIASIAAKIRSGYEKGDYSTDVSTRETLRAASMVADGWKITDVLNMVFLPLFEKEEREIVRRVFVQY